MLTSVIRTEEVDNPTASILTASGDMGLQYYHQEIHKQRKLQAAHRVPEATETRMKIKLQSRGHSLNQWCLDCFTFQHSQVLCSERWGDQNQYRYSGARFTKEWNEMEWNFCVVFFVSFLFFSFSEEQNPGLWLLDTMPLEVECLRKYLLDYVVLAIGRTWVYSRLCPYQCQCQCQCRC